MFAVDCAIIFWNFLSYIIISKYLAFNLDEETIIRYNIAGQLNL